MFQLGQAGWWSNFWDTFSCNYEHNKKMYATAFVAASIAAGLTLYAYIWKGKKQIACPSQDDLNKEKKHNNESVLLGLVEQPQSSEVVQPVIPLVTPQTEIVKKEDSFDILDTELYKNFEKYLEIYNQDKKILGELLKTDEGQQNKEIFPYIYHEMLAWRQLLGATLHGQDAWQYVSYKRPAIHIKKGINGKVFAPNVPAKSIIQEIDEKGGLSQDVKRNLVGVYKIHFMPKPKDIYKVVASLLTHEELYPFIQQIKYVSPILLELNKTGKIKFNLDDYPYVVVYSAPGKENAQLLLNTLYGLFKGVEGMNQIPRYNQKVTSLLYVSQGEGYDKVKLLRQNKINDYFDNTYDYAYYRSDFLGTSEKQEYNLQIPKD